MKPLLLRLSVITILLVPAGLVQAGIVDTVHNLSASGPGTVRASTEDRICIFCHTPHNSTPSGPLWNRNDPGLNYLPYSSSTAQANPGQPTGASLLCLSCHDGTVALGKIVNPDMTITMQGATLMPSGSGRLGTDLSDDHPVSFVYSASLASQNGELVDPAMLSGPVKLDGNGELQCTSCHDPHNNDLGSFLLVSNRQGALCTTCHRKDQWNLTAHNLSTATWDGTGADPWPFTNWTTVSDNACQNCHQPHLAGQGERLLNYPAEEQNCSACHNGHVAQLDVMNEFNRFSRHPIDVTTGNHDPGEPGIINNRHVECFDCHNPHAARAGTAVQNGPLAGVRGISITGSEIDPINNEYEVCLRCHGDSANMPVPRTTRQIPQNNVRLEFSTANPSYHPVAGVGQNPNVPSLISPLTTGSIIKCTDCHNSSAGPNAGGFGPNGPHGSDFEPILERRYEVIDPNPYVSSDYALCYKCHSEASITGNQSGFPHRLHTGAGGGGGGMGGKGDNVNASCNVCHDPHGISAAQGNATNNAHLINFDISVVSPNSSGLLYYESLGTFRGRCYLSCHGKSHNPKSYGMGHGM